jgi:hypothetical protein
MLLSGFLAAGSVVLLCDASQGCATPSEVLGLMPKGRHQFALAKARTREAAGRCGCIFIACLKVHAEELQSMLDIKRSGPVLREHITTGPSLQPSPFWLDVFRVQGKGRLAALKLSDVHAESKTFRKSCALARREASGAGRCWRCTFGYTQLARLGSVDIPLAGSKKHITRPFSGAGEAKSAFCNALIDTDARGRLLITENRNLVR